MSGDPLVLELARTIRMYLPELLADRPDAAAEAAAADRDVSELLERAAQGDDIEEPLLARLTSDDALRDWVSAFIQHGGPPDVPREDLRGFSPSAGTGTVVGAAWFGCPVGDDAVWYRRGIGQAVPVCPTHRVPLIARERS